MPKNETSFDWFDFTLIFQQNHLGDWGLFFLFLVGGITMGKLGSFLLKNLGSRLSRTGWAVRGGIATRAAGPFNLGLITLGLGLGFGGMTTSLELTEFMQDILLFMVYTGVFWYLWALVGVLEIALQGVVSRTETKLDDMLVPLVKKILRLFILVLGVLLVSENVFEQNIAAWLAGFGIAGIAVSLAAQDSLKNLFGSITILLDKPFKLGDRIIFAGFDGPVEEIGFRSVKIRTLSGNLVTIPNSKVVSEAVENVGSRPHIRRVMNLALIYETPPDKLREALRIIQSLFKEAGLQEPIHGSVGKDSFYPRVYFSELNVDHLELFVIYWYAAPVYWDYMDHAQRFNLRIMEEFEKAGIEFAYPTQRLLLEKGNV